MRVVVVNHLSLDGVLQAPMLADEDTRDEFRHGGWTGPTADPELESFMGERLGENFSWLFGRRTYDHMLAYWNKTGPPFKDGLNNTPKYVVSSNPDADVPWPNSILVSEDEVATLRERDGGNLVIMGSSVLVRSLLARELVDEMVLFIHPVVLGSGRRMFGSMEDLQRFRLRRSKATQTGVLMTVYGLAS